jgi:eukaryotic-like serine/threonine-protein kinase
MDQGNYSEAEPLLRDVLEARRRVLGAEHPNTIKSMHALAVVYQKEGKSSQSETVFKETQDLRRRVLGENNPDTRTGMILLADVELHEQKLTEAEGILRQAIEGYEKNDPQNWERYQGEVLLGACLTESRKYADAEPLLISGYEGLRKREAEIPSESRPVLQEAAGRIARFYHAWGKPDKAQEWQGKTAAK